MFIVLDLVSPAAKKIRAGAGNLNSKVSSFVKVAVSTMIAAVSPQFVTSPDRVTKVRVSGSR
jgi:hypothetical protein